MSRIQEQLLEEKAIEFNQRRTEAMLNLTLDNALKIKPILFAINHVYSAGKVARIILDNALSEIEEHLFGKVFKDIPVTDRKIFYLVVEKVNKCDETFHTQYGIKADCLFGEFYKRFCTSDGKIDWSLVQFNSGNYDLDKFLP